MYDFSIVVGLQIQTYGRSRGSTAASWSQRIQNQFPVGWNTARVQRVLAHYEQQNDVEAVAEDEAAYRSTKATLMKVPVKFVPAVRALLAKRRAS